MCFCKIYSPIPSTINRKLESEIDKSHCKKQNKKRDEKEKKSIGKERDVPVVRPGPI